MKWAVQQGLATADDLAAVLKPFRAKAIEAMVASTFSVSRDAIRGPRRGSAGTAFARQVAIYLSHTRLGLSYTEAGAFFGRDRTTAAHACRKVEERREDPKIDALVDHLERAIDICPAAGGRSAW